ncbi:MAG: helix-turn-helix transcriptional regulator [Prevotella sp.]
MPINKGALIRRQVLDSCLSSNRNYTLLELMAKCNDVLREHGFKEISSENTIRSDLFEMEAQFPQAEITSFRRGRNIFYTYKNKDFSIYKIPLTNNEILGLTQALSILSRFDGMQSDEWLDSLIERLKPNIGIDTSVKHIVGFDDNIDLRGREHFSVLLKAIVAKEVLLVRYFSYHKPEEFKAIIHPYYLKQYNNRWFLFGYDERREAISSFAFDRIQEVTTIPKKYRINSDIDFDDYFYDMIGVSRNQDDKPQEVLLFISKRQLPYILSKPLHGTQRIIENLVDGAIISIKVIINYELEQTILALGENIKILKPTSLVSKIHDRISAANNLYQ